MIDLHEHPIQENICMIQFQYFYKAKGTSVFVKVQGTISSGPRAICIVTSLPKKTDNMLKLGYFERV